ncbi:MAG: alkaline shock response membrane anchor protein AmaP [Tissierellia bacterium]|nr:alkaline shock response membrane anchor protein AmaP [Tissierellia bacterium]
MRMGKKIMDFLIGLILLVFATVFFLSAYGKLLGLGGAQRAIGPRLHEEWAFYGISALFAILVFYGLFLILRALFSKKRENSLSLEYPQGEVLLTEASMDRVAKYALDRCPQVLRSTADVRILRGDPPRIDAQAEVQLKPGSPLAETAEKIQQQLKGDLEHFVGLEVQEVTVKVIQEDQPQHHESSGEGGGS